MSDQPAFTLASLAPSTDVLEAFLALGRKMPAKLAMIECRNIAERLVLKRVQDHIEPCIEAAYDTVQFSNGYADPDTMTPEELEVFTDAVDESLFALFNTYRPSITLDFIGRETVSAHLHVTPDKGPDEVAQLAARFAKDAWRVLIHDADEDSTTHVLTTAKILSAIGIVEDDLAEILGDMPGPTEAQTARAMKDLNMRSMNEVFNMMYEAGSGAALDRKELEAYFDMAIDNNDALAVSGLVPLGLEADCAPTMRLFAAKYGANAFAEFMTGVAGAPYDEDVTDSVPDVDITGEAGDDLDEEQDPEMREMMGLPPLPAAIPHGAGATGNVMAGILNRPPGVTPAAPGRPQGPLDKRVFQLIRQHVKRKDDDVAALIGVSRQTFINYADPAKKATFVASPDQHAALLALIEEEMQGLLDARNLLDGNG